MPRLDPPKATRWKPGQSGNPAGLPKGTISIKTILTKYLNQELDMNNPLSKKLEKMTVAEIIQLQKIGKAIKGDMKAIEMIEDRMEGKPSNTTVIANPDGSAVTLNNLWVNVNDASGKSSADTPKMAK